MSFGRGRGLGGLEGGRQEGGTDRDVEKGARVAGGGRRALRIPQQKNKTGPKLQWGDWEEEVSSNSSSA